MRWLVLLLGLGAERTDYVELIEVNTFGLDPPRTALIYRDATNAIRDWRWQNDKNLPVQVRPGLWLACWNDNDGRMRVVYTRSVRFTRTKQDVELEERAKLPEYKRRRLAP